MTAVLSGLALAAAGLMIIALNARYKTPGWRTGLLRGAFIVYLGATLTVAQFSLTVGGILAFGVMPLAVVVILVSRRTRSGKAD